MSRLSSLSSERHRSALGWAVFFCVLAVAVGLFIWAIVRTIDSLDDAHAERAGKRQACELRNGVPALVGDDVICFSKTSVIK